MSFKLKVIAGMKFFNDLVDDIENQKPRDPKEVKDKIHAGYYLVSNRFEMIKENLENLKDHFKGTLLEKLLDKMEDDFEEYGHEFDKRWKDITDVLEDIKDKKLGALLMFKKMLTDTVDECHEVFEKLEKFGEDIIKLMIDMKGMI